MRGRFRERADENEPETIEQFLVLPCFRCKRRRTHGSRTNQLRPMSSIRGYLRLLILALETTKFIDFRMPNGTKFAKGCLATRFQFNDSFANLFRGKLAMYMAKKSLLLQARFRSSTYWSTNFPQCIFNLVKAEACTMRGPAQKQTSRVISVLKKRAHTQTHIVKYIYIVGAIFCWNLNNLQQGMNNTSHATFERVQHRSELVGQKYFFTRKTCSEGFGHQETYTRLW